MCPFFEHHVFFRMTFPFTYTNVLSKNLSDVLRINYRHVGDAYSFSVVDFFLPPLRVEDFCG